MKTLIKISILLFPFLLSGCYTQLAVRDYKETESRSYKYYDEDAESTYAEGDTVYYDDESGYTEYQTEDAEYYAESGDINVHNYYFDDYRFPRYRSYYWGYYPRSTFWVGINYYDPFFDPWYDPLYWGYGTIWPGYYLIPPYYYFGPSYWHSSYYYPGYYGGSYYSWSGYKYRTHNYASRNNDGSRGREPGVRDSYGDRNAAGMLSGGRAGTTGGSVSNRSGNTDFTSPEVYRNNSGSSNVSKGSDAARNVAPNPRDLRTNEKESARVSAKVKPDSRRIINSSGSSDRIKNSSEQETVKSKSSPQSSGDKRIITERRTTREKPVNEQSNAGTVGKSNKSSAPPKSGYSKPSSNSSRGYSNSPRSSSGPTSKSKSSSGSYSKPPSSSSKSSSPAYKSPSSNSGSRSSGTSGNTRSSGSSRSGKSRR